MRKGCVPNDLMDSQDQTDRLHDVVNEMLGRSMTNALSRYTPPFDITKSNHHDSKSEFLAEKAAIERAIRGAEDVMAFFTGDDRTEDDAAKARQRGYRDRIDEQARKYRTDAPVKSALDVIRNAAVQSSQSVSTFVLLLDFKHQLEIRLQELDDQEKEFWTVSNRPPNHYARTIALRVARLYAKERQTKPTFGLSRDGGFPDTDFGRALEKIFQILGISIRPRGPAEWAIAQLTEVDLKPAPTGILGGLFGYADEAGSLSLDQSPLSAYLEGREKG